MKVRNYDKAEIKKIPLINIINNYIVSENYKKIQCGRMYESCPFCIHKHHFQIDVYKNLYHSHAGCCKGGDIIQFIMEMDSLSFNESLVYLGDMFKVNQSEYINNDSKRELEILRLLKDHDKQREQKEINQFFDFLKFMEYEELFDTANYLIGTELIHYIYNLKAKGIYTI